MSTWFVIPFLAAILTYWGASYRAGRLLLGERRRLGDTRPVPDLLTLVSHRWLPILLFEKTREFRPQARFAFTVARFALCLTPVAFFLFIIGLSVTSDSPNESYQGSMPPVVLSVPD
jgi:hypothetical protein